MVRSGIAVDARKQLRCGASSNAVSASPFGWRALQSFSRFWCVRPSLGRRTPKSSISLEPEGVNRSFADLDESPRWGVDAAAPACWPGDLRGLGRAISTSAKLAVDGR